MAMKDDITPVLSSVDVAREMSANSAAPTPVPMPV